MGDRDCTHLCISIWSWIWSGLRPSRIQNPPFPTHASDLRSEEDKTEQDSDKHRSVGSQAWGAAIQSGTAKQTRQQGRQGRCLLREPWARSKCPVAWRQSPVSRELCPRNSWCKSGCTVPARLVIPSSSVHLAAIAVNSLLNGVFEEAGRCVARRWEVKGALLVLWYLG